MSLIVQVAGGGTNSPPQPVLSKGMTSHTYSPGPPPAHVTQLTSSPALSQHVVQHHPQPAPRHAHRDTIPRSLPLSPHRAFSLQRGPPHGVQLAGPSHVTLPSRLMLNGSSAAHLPSSALPLLTPSPAHQLIPTNVNSPSLIPQNIPSGLIPLPRLPAPPSPHSPIFPLSSAPPDTTILPPHIFRKLTRTTLAHPDDDVDMSESPPSTAIGRRHCDQPDRRGGHISPKQRDRRGHATHISLSDHNYCAAPPPSPPRSPTPPPSPYPHMGLPPQESLSEQQSFTFGIAGYGGSPPVTSPPPAPYPSPQYVANNAPSPGQFGTPMSRMMVNRQTIEEAGVGPMTPLIEEERASEERETKPVGDGDGGEETETAPEADDEAGDDSVTRCICDFQHDDGYMICCDKCFVWQHVVCMGLDRANIPEEYLCEKCSPRQLDKKRARMLQTRREREIFNNGSSDDDGKKSGLNKPKKGPVPGTRKGPGKKMIKSSFKKMIKSSLDNKTKGIKKNYKRRGLKEGGTKGDGTNKKQLSPRKGRRKSQSATDTEKDEEDKVDDPAMMLRSWIDTYEEAVTNHYSQELRSRLERLKVSPTCQVKPKDVLADRSNVSLRGNGLKVLTASSHIPANTPITECRGKYMLSSQYRDPEGRRNLNSPFVLVHKLCPDLEVCVDSKTYGNNSRFCRRSSQTDPVSHNAEVRHHLDKGSLHLYIVARVAIEKNQEILLPPEPKNGFLPPLSISDELREIKKVNGLTPEDSGGGVEADKPVTQRKGPTSKPGLKRRLKPKREIKKLVAPPTSSSDDDRDTPTRGLRDTPLSPRKTRFRGATEKKDDKKQDMEVKIEKMEKEEEREVKEEKPSEEKSAEKLKMAEPEIEEARASPQLEEKIVEPVAPVPSAKPVPVSNPDNEPTTPTNKVDQSQAANPSIIKSPGKMGLPDQSGLIVGVNTIDYDVSIRNKAQTREEKKMEMIMKAIEDMERKEARKKHEGELGLSDGGKLSKRRRSNSNAKKSDNVDSALDASSADEAHVEVKPMRRGRRKVGNSALTPQRRRSRAKSGDSLSASADEAASVGIEAHQEFRFPKHKKHMVAEYLGNADSEGIEDDVSSSYLRGSRSPPGIANHLLRSTSVATPGPKSPVKSIGCSAKKRWLRAAMSEDHSESLVNGGEGGASPAPVSPEPSDHYTPLKKRRLASYKESGEDSPTPMPELPAGFPASVTEKFKVLPNGLKKRLISNLVLEAVLDKAMDEMLPDINDKEEIVEVKKEDVKDDLGKEYKNAKVVIEQTKSVQDSLEEVIKNEIKEVKEEFQAEEKEEVKELENIIRSPPSKKQKLGPKKRKNSEKKELLESLETAQQETKNVATEGKAPLAETDEETVGKCESSDRCITGDKLENSSDKLENYVTADESSGEKLVKSEEETGDEIKSVVTGVETVEKSVEPESKPSAVSDKVSDETDKTLSRGKSVDKVVDKNSDKPQDKVIDRSDKVVGDKLLDTPVVKLSEPSQHSVFKSFFSTDLSVEDIDRQLEARREQLARESSMTPLSPRQESGSDSSSRPPSAVPATPPPDTPSTLPPKEKKRMSLADYKKRRQICVSDCVTRKDSPLDLCPGQPLSLPVLPGLESYNVNPVLSQLHKLEKLEKEHKENKKKARHPRSECSSSTSTPAPRVTLPTPVLAPDRPREDLTERLRKEFGLSLDVDESEEEKSGEESPVPRLGFGAFSSRSSALSSGSSKGLPVPHTSSRTSQDFVNRDKGVVRKNIGYQRSNYTS